MQCILTSFVCCYSNRMRLRHGPCPIFDTYLLFVPHIVLDWGSPSRIHHHMLEIDSESIWPIIAGVSAATSKELYHFFGCHGNNGIHLLWLLLKNSITPENLKQLCLWFSELQRKRTSTWSQYCSCEVIWALFPFKKWLSWHLPCRKSETLKWNASRTRRGIYNCQQCSSPFCWLFNLRPTCFWADFPFNLVFLSIFSGFSCTDECWYCTRSLITGL